MGKQNQCNSPLSLSIDQEVDDRCGRTQTMEEVVKDDSSLIIEKVLMNITCEKAISRCSYIVELFKNLGEDMYKLLMR